MGSFWGSISGDLWWILISCFERRLSATLAKNDMTTDNLFFSAGVDTVDLAAAILPVQPQ